MELIGQEKKMTVKEVADALGTAESTIRNKVKELFPEIVENGKATMITERQAHDIKTAIIPRGLTLKSKLENAVTEIEKQQTIILAMQYLQEGYNAMKARAVEAEARVDRLVHNSHTYSTTEIAKELGMKSAHELNQRLLEMGVHFKDRRGMWLLNSEYSDKGFQNIKQKEIDGKKDPVYYAEWTGIGRDWLVGMFYNTVQS